MYLQFPLCIMFLSSEEGIQVEYSWFRLRFKWRWYLYKSLGTMDLLSADELPKSVVMSNYNIPKDYLELETDIANLRTGEPFLRRINSVSEYDETMLSFIRGFTTAIMKQHGYFYLFDSHSRDERGLSISWGNISVT